MNDIKIGYEVPTGKAVIIRPSHLIVTGITQESGKTTTLEALISRAHAKAIVFKTKKGEKSFQTGTYTAPFFRQRSDYEFVRSLIEAYSKERLFMEKGTLMQLCKGSKDLIEIKRRIDEKLNPSDPKAKKPTGFMVEIYTRLEHYLNALIPQIQYASFSSTLNLVEGVNIMDLEQFSFEAQSLIVSSVCEEVLNNARDAIIVVPEAWKFLPQKNRNPCKDSVERLIKQGATNGNYVWIDSQAMADVDKSPLKQISTWILGYQKERNEVTHTLDQIPLPKSQRPKEEEIMNLQIGHFFVSDRDRVVKVYVQPTWLSDQQAIDVAMDLMELETAKNLKPMSVFNLMPIGWNAALEGATLTKVMSTSGPNGIQPVGSQRAVLAEPAPVTRAELIELRRAFFGKLSDTISDINGILSSFKPAEPKEIDLDELASKVMEQIKMPSIISGPQMPPLIDLKAMSAMMDEKIAQVKSIGTVSYSVSPLEKIKKDFLSEAKDKIVKDVSTLGDDAKRTMRYLESKGKGTKANELVEKCFLLKNNGTMNRRIQEFTAALISIDVCRKDSSGNYYGELKSRINTLLSNHDATKEEIENVYNHVIMEILK